MKGVVSQKAIFKDPTPKTYMGHFHVNRESGESFYVRLHVFFLFLDDPAHGGFSYMPSLLGYEMRKKPLTEIRLKINTLIGQTV